MKKLIFILLFIPLAIQAQVVVTVSGIDTTLTGGTGYDFNATSTTTLTVENSRFATAEDGYIVKVGEDGYTPSTVENLNGAVVSGNLIENTNAVGTGSNHSVMAGYNLDYKIRYNHFKNVYYGVVAEGGYNNGDSMVNTQYDIFGNIFEDVRLPLSAAGYDGINFYGNTVYSSHNSSLWMIKNILNEWGGMDFPATGKNLRIYNNIFYTVYTDEIINLPVGMDVGFECDYNVYYCENSANNEPRFNFNGSVLTWTQWQAEGYDTHSVILDPEFIDEINFIPGIRLDYGIDLGSSYDNLISTAGEWQVGYAPVLTSQNGEFQVGARIHPADTTSGDYWVSPLGDDANSGTYKYPWATVQHGFDNGDAGDTVWYRAGVWFPDDDTNNIINFDPNNSNGNDGTYANWVIHERFPADSGYATIDCKRNFINGSTAGLRIRNATFVKFSGFEIKNNWHRATDNSTIDLTLSGCGNIILDNMSAHDGGGVGFNITLYDTVWLTNCDSYTRCDSLDPSSPGGDADGFILSSGYDYGEGDHAMLYVTGCRAWNNSDDGIDLASSKGWIVDGGWFFFNGSLYADDGYAGDGTGIKTSGGHTVDVTNRVIKNAVSTYNWGTAGGGGVSELNLYARDNPTGLASGGPVMTLTNNTIYNNYKGYNSGVSGGNWVYGPGVDSASVVSTNNLIYKYTRTPLVAYSEFLTDLGAYDPPFDYTTTTTDSWDWIDPPNHWHNRYNPAFTITDADFTDLDSATIYSELSAPRNQDGSLPTITVLQLVEGSDLIGGGTDIGEGDDLGAFQTTFDTRTSAPLTGTGTKVMISNGVILHNNE